MIRDRRLLPPQPWRADWPWRVHVHALVALRIERDGLPLAAAGKAQKKPLELLALLAAHPGRPLDTDAVIDQLWPSLDANAPRASLDMAVSRLRKLLDLPEAVQLAEGRLFLRPTLVWTDICSFEKLADAAESGDETAAEHALQLYGNALPASEAASGQLLQRRQQLAQRHVELALAQVERLLARRDAPAACLVAQRALAQQTQSEPLHRALMAAQLARGEPAEALRSFERCRQLLLIELAISPSAATLALAERARAAAGA